MTKVAITEAVLSWAIERSGIPFTGLQRRFPKLEEWQRGDAQPTLRQLEDLAKATATPLGFLFLDQPPEERLPVPHFRTVREAEAFRPSANLLDTVHSMQRRQQWMREYLVEDGYEGLPFVRSAALTDEPADVAANIRRVLDLTEEWAAQSLTWMDALRRLRNVIEDAGILVFASGIVGNNTRRKLDVGEFRGFVLVDQYVPLVFVNAADARAAQMFTLAHELAHVWFGPARRSTSESCSQRRTQRNRFATGRLRSSSSQKQQCGTCGRAPGATPSPSRSSRGASRSACSSLHGERLICGSFDTPSSWTFTDPIWWMSGGRRPEHGTVGTSMQPRRFASATGLLARLCER